MNCKSLTRLKFVKGSSLDQKHEFLSVNYQSAFIKKTIRFILNGLFYEFKDCRIILPQEQIGYG